MAYANICWIKLRLEILDDERFLFQCDYAQKWLFIGLLLLAGRTKNKIPNSISYLKNRLNLVEKEEVIKENLNHLLKIFPKLIAKNGYLKFKNFSKFHNPVRTSQGNPEDIPGRSDRVPKDVLEKIRKEYIEKKRINKNILEYYSNSDWNRINKAAKQLYLKSKSNLNLCLEAIKWVSEQGYEWTLETVVKKFPDFLMAKAKQSAVPARLREVLDE